MAEPVLRAVAEGDTPADLSGLPDPFGGDGTGVAVPVIPDLC